MRFGTHSGDATTKVCWLGHLKDIQSSQKLRKSSPVSLINEPRLLKIKNVSCKYWLNSNKQSYNNIISQLYAIQRYDRSHPLL